MVDMHVQIDISTCAESGKMGEYVSTQTLVTHYWAGPSVIVHLAADAMPDKAE